MQPNSWHILDVILTLTTSSCENGPSWTFSIFRYTSEPQVKTQLVVGMGFYCTKQVRIRRWGRWLTWWGWLSLTNSIRNYAAGAHRLNFHFIFHRKKLKNAECGSIRDELSELRVDLGQLDQQVISNGEQIVETQHKQPEINEGKTYTEQHDFSNLAEVSKSVYI